MDTQTPRNRDYGFLIGMLTGTVVGAGLAVWFAPKVREELRQRATDSAGAFSKRASEQYKQVSSRLVDVADDLARKGERVRNDVAGAIAHGAHEVERVATAVRSDRQ